MKKYTAIQEFCGSEGGNWVTFLLIEGNEEYLLKLRELCRNNYSDDSEFNLVVMKDYTDTQVNFLILTAIEFGLGIYDKLFIKVDSIMDIDILNNIHTEEDFCRAYYKRGLFYNRKNRK
jgi:hypothetical protein